MNLELKGKNALICASSSGIGKAIAKELALEGVNVSILARDEEKLAKAKKEIEGVSIGRVISTQCDLSVFSDIDKAVNDTVSEFGGIDILINNHGGPSPGNFEDISMEMTEKALQLNLMSVLYATKLCLPFMVKNGWGRIVNILSISAKESLPNMFLSNTIRPAILGFSKSISLNYADHGITVNSLLPSAVLSERTNFFINKSATEKGISYDEALELASQNLPPKRIATAEEFAKSAVYICSSHASYINGTAIAIDGGLTKSIY